jgi:glycosyltransferase involved in cell wall biosynthesis
MQSIRVLHCVGSLERGGIETWLTNLVRFNHPGLKFDFLLGAESGTGPDYEQEVMDAGCRIFRTNPSTKLQKRLRIIGVAKKDTTLREILQKEKYRICHVHGDEFNGDTMKIAAGSGTPVRVSHCHHTMLARGKRGVEMMIRRLRFLSQGRFLTLKYSTDLLACGHDAGRLMAGNRWDSDPRCRVVYCGVPLASFEQNLTTVSRSELLARYALPHDALVVGHAGSMGAVPVKNHSFLIRSFAELAARSGRYFLVLAGDGPARPELEMLVAQLGVAERVRFTGSISDVPAHMMHLFDVHVLPSLAEGLPVVAIEAASAGLYTVMSTNITDEIRACLPDRIERLPLTAPLATWADRIEAGISRRESCEKGIQRVRTTPLSIDKSAEDLYNVYNQRLAVS